jgi:tRNA(Ile2) C34 agmatinyltransferase TiaS
MFDRKTMASTKNKKQRKIKGKFASLLIIANLWVFLNSRIYKHIVIVAFRPTACFPSLIRADVGQAKIALLGSSMHQNQSQKVVQVSINGKKSLLIINV